MASQFCLSLSVIMPICLSMVKCAIKFSPMSGGDIQRGITYTVSKSHQQDAHHKTATDGSSLVANTVAKYTSTMECNFGQVR